MSNDLPPLSGPVDASGELDRFAPCNSSDPMEHFWTAVLRGWDIEPRAYFEKEAVSMGFKSPVEMAVHHMWKRHAKDWPAAAVPSSPAQDEEIRRWRQAEQELGSRYVKLRIKLEPFGALNTKRNGEDRFEKTEAALDAALAELYSLRALPPSSPVADSPTIQTVVDVRCGQRHLHAELPVSEYRRICHAILSDTAQCPKCRNIVTECSFCYQDRASAPSPSAGADKP